MKFLFRYVVFLLLLITISPSSAYTYDPSGNITSDDVYHYTYNDAGRVKEVRVGSSSGLRVAQFFYDHNGQRIKKIEDGKTCYYISKLFQSCNGKDTKFHFLQGDRIAAIHTDGTKQFFHNDHIGSPIAVSNENGTVIERITYKPFGETTSHPTSSVTSQYTFSGKQKDTNGSYYFEARSYQPHLAIFNRVDPVLPVVGNSFSLNPYQYANNNPLRYTDKSGEAVYGEISFRFIVGGTIAFEADSTGISLQLTAAVGGGGGVGGGINSDKRSKERKLELVANAGGEVAGYGFSANESVTIKDENGWGYKKNNPNVTIGADNKFKLLKIGVEAGVSSSFELVDWSNWF